MTRFLLLLTTLFLLHTSAHAITGDTKGLKIVFPEAAAVSYHAPHFACIGETVPTVTGPVVYWNALNQSDPNFLSQINGSIILILSPLSAFFGRLPGVQQPNDPEWAFGWMKRNGAIGAILIPTSSSIGGGSEHLVDTWEKCRALYPFQVVEMGLNDAPKLVQLLQQEGNRNVTAVLESGDFNMWRHIRRGWYMILFSVIFGLVGLFITSLALAKLIVYIRVFGFELSIAQTSLAIHAAVNMYRFIYVSVDPVYAGRWFNGTVAHSLSTVTWPFPIITTLLVSLYLRELLSKLTMKGNVRISNFLTNMRIPFIILSVVVLGLEAGNSGLRASRASTLNVLTYIVAAVYVSTSALMAGFFIYTGSRVVAQQMRASTLRESSNNTSGKKKSKSKARWTFKAIRYILLAAGFLVLYCIALICLGITAIFYHPIGHYAVWTAIWIALYGVSFSQILAFKTPSMFDLRSKKSLNSRMSSRAASRSVSMSAV